jgi:putative transposase
MPENPRLSSLGMNGIAERSQLWLAEWRKIRHNLAMARYTKGAHTKHRLQYHLVWIPKYRKRVLQGKIAIRLKRLMYEACKMNGWWISEMSMQDDHIHIVVQIPPHISVADVVQIFKGGTSRVLRKEFPEMEEFLWGDSFWADGYFAETVGQVNEEVVKKYIREQKGKP